MYIGENTVSWKIKILKEINENRHLTTLPVAFLSFLQVCMLVQVVYSDIHLNLLFMDKYFFPKLQNLTLFLLRVSHRGLFPTCYPSP